MPASFTSEILANQFKSYIDKSSEAGFDFYFEEFSHSDDEKTVRINYFAYLNNPAICEFVINNAKMFAGIKDYNNVTYQQLKEIFMKAGYIELN